MAYFPTFKGSWPWPWPLIGSYCIPSCISHRPQPTYQISLKSTKLFVDGRTDRHTDGRADGHLRPTLLGRLGWVDLINWFPGLILKHFSVKFGDPSCICFWDIVQRNRQTDRRWRLNRPDRRRGQLPINMLLKEQQSTRQPTVIITDFCLYSKTA